MMQPINMRWKIVFATGLGTVLEWYDFTLFAFLAPTISTLFFPSTNRFISYLSIYSVFAVGFLMRPVGAYVFGHYGDRLGRKTALIYSMTLLSFSTVLIGLLPTFEQVGVWAPILLVMLRLIQGFCIGGETTGAASFAIESHAEKYRGMIGASTWSAVGIGMLLSSLVTTILTHALSKEALQTVGWRLPFFGGILTGVVGYYFRKKMPESSLFLDQKNKGFLVCTSNLQVIKNNKKSIITIAGLYALSAMITYLVFVFMPFYAATVIPISLTDAGMVTTVAMACVTCLVPGAGLLSDYVGRKPCLVLGAGGFLIFSYPLYCWIVSSHSVLVFKLAESCFVILAIFYQGALTSTVQEMTDTSVRYTITAIGYNVSYAVFGGGAPLLVTYFSDLFRSHVVPGVCLAVGALIALFSIVSIHETAKQHLV